MILAAVMPPRPVMLLFRWLQDSAIAIAQDQFYLSVHNINLALLVPAISIQVDIDIDPCQALERSNAIDG